MTTKTKAAARGQRSPASAAIQEPPSVTTPVVMLDGPARATDWMVIARCALESVRDSISTMLGKEAFCLDDEAVNLLIVGEQLAVMLTTMPICAAEEISLELGKIQSVMSGALAMSVSRDTPGFRFLQATVHELSAFMLLIQRAEDNHKVGALTAPN